MASNTAERKKYQPHPDAQLRRESAVLAAKAILALDLYPPHKRKFLSVCIWKMTEADGKYTTRYQTRTAWGADSSELAHEHVYRMELLIDRLLQSPENVASILGEAVACTVTRDEHRHLCKQDRANSLLDGWERYRMARIEVVDTLTGQLHNLSLSITNAKSHIRKSA